MSSASSSTKELSWGSQLLLLIMSHQSNFRKIYTFDVEIEVKLLYCLIFVLHTRAFIRAPSDM